MVLIGIIPEPKLWQKCNIVLDACARGRTAINNNDATNACRYTLAAFELARKLMD